MLMDFQRWGTGCKTAGIFPWGLMPWDPVIEILSGPGSRRAYGDEALHRLTGEIREYRRIYPKRLDAVWRIRGLAKNTRDDFSDAGFFHQKCYNSSRFVAADDFLGFRERTGGGQELPVFPKYQSTTSAFPGTCAEIFLIPATLMDLRINPEGAVVKVELFGSHNALTSLSRVIDPQ
jgi:hypothetical protein